MSTKVSTDLIDLSSNTGGLVWAKGTTAQQPASATAGEMRVDTTTNTTLVYNGTQWKTLKETAFVVPPVPTHFLVIAGGGSGGAITLGTANTGGGAGGAGGLRTSYGSATGGGGSAESTTGISLNTAYTITVGAGGNSIAGDTAGINGLASIFSTITATGGGGGARAGGGTPYNGQTGGSGGGGSAGTTAGGVGGAAVTSPVVQGYAGGNGGFDSSNVSGSAGGGGAGQVGYVGQNGVIGNYGGDGGNGGNGLAVSITGSSVTYAGGGGGGAYSYAGASPGTGGTGGAGDGAGTIGQSFTSNTTAESGSFNTGSGGGGGGNYSGSGGSGVVILRYPTADLPYFTTTGTLNTPSATDTVADTAYPVTNIAYYKLDSNANDSSGNGYNGTATNITYGNGRFNEAANFNGSNSSILATSPTQGNTDASYSFWIKTPTILSYVGSQPSYPVFGQVSDASRNPFSIYWYASTTSGKMTFTMWRCFNNEIWYAQGYLTDFDFTYVANTWYHIVITYTASNKSCKNYVNGNQIGGAPTLSLLASGQSTGTQMKLGSYNNNQGIPFNGSIDQIRIFSSALARRRC